MDERKWESCIDQLYGSIGYEDALAHALGEFRPFFGAQRVLFQTAMLRRNHPYVCIVQRDVPPESLIEYHVAYASEDEWVRATLRQGLFVEGQVVRGSAVVPPELLRQTRFFKNFLSKYDVQDVLCGVIDVPAGGDRPPTFISYHRTHDVEPYAEHDEQALARLLPHLRRALLAHQRLAPKVAIGETLQQLFERMAMPMLLIASDAAVVEANQPAQRLLDDSQALRLSFGRLEINEFRGWTALAPLLGALDSDTGTAERLCAAGVVTVHRSRAAFHDRATAHDVAAAVSVRPVMLPRDHRLVQTRFHLSATELRIGMLLAEGLDVGDAAQQLGCKVTTVRTHVRALLAKTGTTRQSDMLLALSGLGRPA